MKKMLLVMALVGVCASSYGQVVIPDAGVDIDLWVTAAITALGAVVAVVVGGYFAFLIVKKGMRWAGRALG